MRIVQTFWSGCKSPYYDSYGWLHPEFNLMSWALSSCLLRAHYGELTLYTDARGKECLIDILQLPYTDVRVVYDDTLCLPKHWAYSKIKTYAQQKNPFVHIDGDVYFPKQLSLECLNHAVITQNFEYGTSHYVRMLSTFVQFSGITLPMWLSSVWHERPIESYNMGVFGGADIEFIHRYCVQVEKLFKDNCLNQSSDSRSMLNANVVFEQILLASLAKQEGKQVSTVIPKAYSDVGYTIDEFCNFENWQDKELLHIVGGNKRCHSVCEQLERTLFYLYPEYYLHIANLFPNRHPYLATPLGKQLVEFQTRNITTTQSILQNPIQAARTRVYCNPLMQILPYKRGDGAPCGDILSIQVYLTLSPSSSMVMMWRR